ncbi:DUF2958 domain-containing protein [Rhodoferax sp. GW822-FHT02A01]|uniref:DUF2958 domain-containing protein n=1 Tax=Rhodoferax sp. GW822-FHT02A01 TaxID=3141537 RepID=UPI00315D3063
MKTTRTPHMMWGRKVYMELLDEIKKRCEGFPLYSQENVSDPTIRVKLCFPIGKAAWYISEYDSVTMIAFGYVTGLAYDEWGYVSIRELLEAKIADTFSIMIDPMFKPMKVSCLGIVR